MRQSGESARQGQDQAQAEVKNRWSVRWGSVAPILVVVVWLLASWSASAAARLDAQCLMSCNTPAMLQSPQPFPSLNR